MIHTTKGVYNVRDRDTEFNNLMTEPDYEVPDLGYISSCTAFNQYFFCSLGTDIYYWDGGDEQVHKLEGTYDPPKWMPNKQYQIGDIVKPTDKNYSGYVYRCYRDGRSGSTEPNWKQDMSNSVKDNTCHWLGCGSSELEGTSGLSIRAQCVENYKGFLFLGCTEEDGDLYPSRLRWSQWQNPRLWHNNEDGSGMSGYVDADDIEGRIIAIKKIGDILAIYKERGIISISYTGDETVFSKELITTKAGLVSPNAIIVLPHSHVFIGKDNIYEFDGNTVVPIGDPIRNWFFNDLKSIDRIIGYYNESSKDIIFAYDNTGSNDINRNKAITYNTYTHAWSVRDMNITALGDFCENDDYIIDEFNQLPKDVYDPNDTNDKSFTGNLMIDTALYKKEDLVVLAGDENGKIYKLNGYSDSRGDYDGWVISKTHHMEDPLHIKRLLRIQFHVETQGDYDMYVQVRPSWSPETPKEQIAWENLPVYTLNFRNSNTQQHVVPPFVDLDLSARYFQVKFGTHSNNEYFKVLGYTLYYQTRGDM